MSARAAASASGRAFWSASAGPQPVVEGSAPPVPGRAASGIKGLPTAAQESVRPPATPSDPADAAGTDPTGTNPVGDAPGGTPSAEADAGAPADAADHGSGEPDAPHHVHPHLSDRWRWRRRIRANPRQLFIYRIVIGVLGLLCICAGAVTGPLPGPGGIPLVLLGLAIWASEFRWAHRLMEWFKLKLHQVRGLTPGKKALFWVCFALACLLLGYLGLLIVGTPDWLPASVQGRLSRLPGVR